MTGYKINGSDQAYFLKTVDGKALAHVCSHVDELLRTGANKIFMERRKSELEISRLVKGKFRFTGLDMEGMSDGLINVSMEDYAASIQDIASIRQESGYGKRLNDAEISIYREYV